MEKKKERCEVRGNQASEETPSKKLRLVVDYSDSDEENEANEMVEEEKDESEEQIKCKTVETKRVETSNENSKINEELRQDHEKTEKAADVDMNEIIKNILEMIVESVSKENEEKYLLKQYDEQNITMRSDDELLTLETRKRQTQFRDSNDDDDDDDATDQNNDFTTEFVDISEIDFSFFP